MAIYMIDYENVKTGGLNGISRLTEEDSVIIFYSENANRLTFDLHQRLMACRAKIEYREVTVGGHNALDFQLVTYLGYLIAQNRDGQYLIISNDRGFEYVINFWRKDGLAIGLLPYLKDPAYALQKVIRTEPVSEKETATDEPASATPGSETAEEVSATPEEPKEEIPVSEEFSAGEPAETEEGITVEFYIDETPDEPSAEEVALPADETKEEPLPELAAEEQKQEKKPSRKRKPKEHAKDAAKTEESVPEQKEQPAKKPLPRDDELREMLGSLVEDDPEFRFVLHAMEKYKTKLGLNNALVKNFGNQRAGEIYQLLKPMLNFKKGN